VPGIRDYRAFISDLEGELLRIESILAEKGLSGAPCRTGCSECCLPLSVLPLEAYAIMGECEDRHARPAAVAANPERCAFLEPDGSCAIYGNRPFLCRTRGFPILYMNPDGEWSHDSCANRSYPPLPEGTPGLRLEEWNARLFRMNAVFCRDRGVAPFRVALASLRAN
jgi:uncharacterized protein